jgi:hypothetical protein
VRIGYSYWGFLGDIKLDRDGNELSTPDGNATYSWSILWEAQRRGHEVWAMQEDRDRSAWNVNGVGLFKSFSQQKRANAYRRTEQTNGHMLPDLDVLLVEWRFPIPGRNCVIVDGRPQFGGEQQPDLWRQTQLLQHYLERGTRVIAWDLDHKLERGDEAYWGFDAVFETSQRPRHLLIERTQVEPPFVIDDLMQHETLPVDPRQKLVYVGSRYERDDVITEFVKPVSDRWPGEVMFYGNWLNTLDECRALWPNVSYNGRIGVAGFRQAYGRAVACPLLAKRSYLKTGFITPRPWEALLFGTIPIGIHRSQVPYTHLIGANEETMVAWIEDLTTISPRERDDLRRDLCHELRFMDVRNFVDEIENVVNA